MWLNMDGPWTSFYTSEPMDYIWYVWMVRVASKVDDQIEGNKSWLEGIREIKVFNLNRMDK